MEFLCDISLGGVWGPVASLLFLLLCCYSFYILLNSIASPSPSKSVLFFIFFTIINPDFLVFSSIYPAVLLFLWSFFCLSKQKIFASAAFLSASTLFYPPFLYFLPLMVIFILDPQEMARGLVKVLAGFLTPLLYLLAFCYFSDSSVIVLLESYFAVISGFSLPAFSFSLTTVALILFLFYLTLRSLLDFFVKSDGGATRRVLYASFVLVAFSLFLFFSFYHRRPLLMNIIPAFPLSILIPYHFRNITNIRTRRMEALLLAAFMILSFLQVVVGI